MLLFKTLLVISGLINFSLNASIDTVFKFTEGYWYSKAYNDMSSGRSDVDLPDDIFWEAANDLYSKHRQRNCVVFWQEL